MDQSQPDFEIISTKFTTLGQDFSAKCVDLGHQFSLCGNIPAIIGGEQIAASLDLINQNLVRINDRLDSLDARVGSLDTRMGSLETRMGSLDTHMGSLDTRVGSLETRMGSLDSRVRSGSVLHDELIRSHADFVHKGVECGGQVVEQPSNELSDYTPAPSLAAYK
ncbi:hypothetical protein NUW58_g9677 [Xylaria curta]|uniref:Uncharacterized protein n=1 Tax=Xylaria curta TaxID=42375 RepID=A0ACC1MUJ8_9PEZI|nr:hypothetical protein NUW58_g9677 [Xylaria curta]